MIIFANHPKATHFIGGGHYNLRNIREQSPFSGLVKQNNNQGINFSATAIFAFGFWYTTVPVRCQSVQYTINAIIFFCQKC